MSLYTTMERELSFFILADITSTVIALNYGAVESNKFPAQLIQIHPGLWVASLIAVLVWILLVARTLNAVYRNKIGILILIVPTIIEASAFINNVGVIRSLI
jgi:Domain of unknown function (DUF5658)